MCKVDDARKLRIQELLWADIRSGSDFDRKFMSVHELAELLGVTRQAILANRTIFSVTCILQLPSGKRYFEY